MRSISNVVDITNLVMLEYGHPMHAFDLDRVRPDANGKKHIVVRRAKDGEVLKTLDGVARKLAGDDLLICDGEGPVALAGVMGGGSSEIQADTKRVLYECAWFDRAAFAAPRAATGCTPSRAIASSAASTRATSHASSIAPSPSRRRSPAAPR